MIPRLLLLPLLALAAAVLAGCGGGGGGSPAPTAGPAASLSPGSLSFPMQLLATPSAASTVTLQNTGNATLTLSASPITLTGTNSADFSFTTTCGASLAVAASCSISVIFTPSAGGTRSATLNVASNAVGSPAALAISGTATGDNALAVTVDSGPLPSTNPTANILYADVTFCTPGSTTACAVVHHIQVDTGSYGLRVFKSALTAAAGSAVVPALALAAGTTDPLFECVQYADGYTWGSVATVDVQIGTRRLSNLRIQLTGDTNGNGGVPTSCSNGTPNENQVSQFGANGILGIGNFLQDCGQVCASAARTGYYYQCPLTAPCTPVAVALGAQVQNPVSLLATDNNGVLLSLPPVSGHGQATLNGFVYFGVNTQSDNMTGAATWFGLDPTTGEFTTNYGSSVLTKSFVDSGSNAYFFSSALAVCTHTYDAGFYCPTAATAVTAVINGATNTATATINFTVDNTDTLFTTYSSYAVYPNLAGPNTGVASGLPSAFDWGLPFFYGRPVAVLFEGHTGPTGSNVAGPALAF